MIRYSHISFPLTVFIFVALVALWMDQIPQSHESADDEESFDNPDYIIENVSGVRTDHTKTIHRYFSAEILFHYFEKNITRMQDVDFISIGSGKPVFHLQADLAEIQDKGKNILLKENVSAVRSTEKEKDQITLTTDFLHLIPNEDVVLTKRPVTIKKPDSVINATGMEFNNQTGILKLLSNVHTVHYKSSSKK